MINELALTESKVLREEYMNKDEILDKVKALVLLQDNINVTVEMVSNYYEVEIEAIKSLIFDHRDELDSDGITILKGAELKDFKGQFLKGTNLESMYKFAPSLTIIPRRAILRIGMLLRDSEIAKQIRTYLLNVENNTDVNTKLMSLSQESNDTLKLLNTKISDIEKFNAKLSTDNDEIKLHNYNLINKIDELLNQPLFTLYKNTSSEYERLLTDFTDIMRDKGYYHGNYGKDYSLFNREFGNWVGKDFQDKKLNKKDYWLNFYGIDIIKHFIYGIKQGIIIKNKKDNWIDKNGIFNNKVEWIKIQKEFNHECAYCGKSDVILLPEHIIYQSNTFSTNTIFNIVPACSTCNESKFNNDIRDWYKKQSFFNVERYSNIKQHWNNYYKKFSIE